MKILNSQITGKKPDPLRTAVEEVSSIWVSKASLKPNSPILALVPLSCQNWEMYQAGLFCE